MDSTGRRSLLIYGMLAGLWALVIAWQVQEHLRVRESARMELRTRAHEIANTLSAFIRGLRFRGTVLQDRIVPVLDEMVQARTNALTGTTELLSVALLNAAGEPMASAGQPIDLTEKSILQDGEHWAAQQVILVRPVDLGAQPNPEGDTNRTVVLPSMQDLSNTFREGRQEPRDNAERNLGAPPPPPDSTNGRPPERPGGDRWRRPPWMRGMDEPEFRKMMERRALHGLVLALSTESVQNSSNNDLLLRVFIGLLATMAVVGSALAWKNLTRNADLQIRLVKASEMNTHLREMNVAAAGLAHETRNPLNIIRGLAHIISRNERADSELRTKSKEIMDEADKVAAQLNEFINYSRPREVRWAPVALGPVTHEVVRALGYDIEEKKVQLQIAGEHLTIRADEQLLRQALFNLLLNAIQAVPAGGRIQVSARRQSDDAVLEISDNGPGVPPDQREEIFKPYFTTHKTGTGLGLAVVQQIVLAHGWEITCLASESGGARFRISHIAVL